MFILFFIVSFSIVMVILAIWLFGAIYIAAKNKVRDIDGWLAALIWPYAYYLIVKHRRAGPT